MEDAGPLLPFAPTPPSPPPALSYPGTSAPSRPWPWLWLLLCMWCIVHQCSSTHALLRAPRPTPHAISHHELRL